MKIIRTLLGDINPDDLGFTNGHEHIVCVPPYWEERNQYDLLLDDESKSLLDVIDYKNYNGKSIVDATAIDYGRRVLEVANISNKTGIHVIGTAGFNKSFLWKANVPERLRNIIDPKYKTFEDWVNYSSIDELVKIVTDEMTIGLEGTKYKAGQVKFGTGYNSITPLEEKTIEVITTVQKKLKCPMHSHTEAGTMALEQIELVKKYNGDLSKWCIGHMDRNLDFYYHEKIVEHGIYLSFDGLGKNKYGPESHRIDAIMNLIKKGYINQILLGGDNARRSYYKNYDYGLGLQWIPKVWVKRFEEECINNQLDPNEVIQKLFIENPKRYLTFEV